MKQASVWLFCVVAHLWTYVHNQLITTVLWILLPAVPQFFENQSPPQKSGKQIHFKITAPFQNPYYYANVNIAWCFGKCVFLLVVSLFLWKAGESYYFTANSSCAGLSIFQVWVLLSRLYHDHFSLFLFLTQVNFPLPPMTLASKFIYLPR